MDQNNKDKDSSDVSGPNYEPEQDPEIADNVSEEIERLRDKLMPYQRYIMIIGIIVLILLVVFLGYAYGGLKVCSELDGLLDKSFKCHPNYKPEPIYNIPQTIVPNFTINVSNG